MKIHHLSVEAALASLNTSLDGLNHAEAARRLQEFGPNRVEHITGTPLWLRFLKEFTHFFALILWVAAGLAFAAEAFESGQGMATLGWTIIGVILVNGVFSFWQEYRAEKALAALESLLPHQVEVVREGEVQQIPAALLVPGDILLLEEGDNVPADCRLIESLGVRVNNATVTGESLPKARDAKPSTEENFMLAKNILLAGTSIVSGEAKAVVSATGSHSEFGKIASLTQAAREPMSPLQREIARLSHLIATISISLGVAFFIVGQLIGLPFWANFIFSIGIIVANVPEGLLPTVTLALAMATQRMARRNALVRHLSSVETLGSATVILTDKTGTLTQNRMAVKQVFLAGKQLARADILADTALLNTWLNLFEGMGLCHNLKPTDNAGWLGDPMEVALVRMAEETGIDPSAFPKLGEVPFDTDRKRLSTLHQTPTGLLLHTKGAPEVVLALCDKVKLETSVVPLTAELRESFSASQARMADQGLRVLAFAERMVQTGLAHAGLEQDMTLIALVGLEDPPRPEVPQAIQQCFDAGIRVIMVTGDHPHTAHAIGREIGLIRSDNPAIITGDELRRLSPIQLQLALDAPEIIFARVTADQKLHIVIALKRKKHIVAVTGDGVNDAPALRHADIGIAMGIMGSDVAKESADIILLDDNFASVVSAVEEGRAVFENIRKFLTYILTHNMAELVPYLAFATSKIPLPLTVMQILAIDLGTDTLPALALGSEKPQPGLMQRPPRSRHERLLNWPLALRAYLFLGLIEASAALSAFFFVLRSGGWHYGQLLPAHDPLYVQATTATLSAIIVMQVVNVFLCRSQRDSAFSFGIFSNRLILAGIAFEIALILLIDYTPWGNALFGTAPIDTKVWLFVIPFALGMLVLEEIRKWLMHKLFQRHRD